MTYEVRYVKLFRSGNLQNLKAPCGCNFPTSASAIRFVEDLHKQVVHEDLITHDEWVLHGEPEIHIIEEQA